VVLGGVAVVGALLLASAPAVRADATDDAVSTLATSSLYVAPDATGKVSNTDSVTSALGPQAKVAVLSADVDIASAGAKIQASLSGRVTLAIVWGKQRKAKSSYLCAGFAQQALDQAFAANKSQLNSDNDLTNTLVEFGHRLVNGPTTNCSSGSGPASGSEADSSFGGGDAGSAAGSSSSNAWAWIVGVVAAIAAAVAGFGFVRRRKTKRLLSDARAKVVPYYDRLAADINSIEPGDNATARQAMADAGQRFESAGAQLQTADSVAKYGQARRTVLEGLTASRTARTALGLDPGPDLPPIDEAQGDQLTQAQPVTVQGQTFNGYPNYTPGAPYYYGGGYGVPGGWYGTPFWETLLIGSVLAGGFGGFGGGGYNQGYGSGYDQGYDAGQNADGSSGNNAGGGDWGSGGWGGGDSGGWGGGGGDSGGWGGDSGGGGGSDSGGGW
jgi:hypothetical protein